MTKGSEWKSILAFSMPLMLSGLFQQLYSIVDSIVVGRAEGPAALAAISASFPALFLVTSVIIGFTTATAVLVSQLYGAKRYDDLRRAVTTGFIVVMSGGIALMAIGTSVAGPLLRLLDTPEEVFVNAHAYLMISFMAIPCVVIYNILGNILRGMGDSKTPLYAVMLATVLNIMLDIYFVTNLGMGVRGVAYATAISQLTSGVIELVYVMKHVPELRFKASEIKFDKVLFKQMVKLAVPSTVQMAAMSAGFLAVQGLVNTFGANTMAAYGAAMRVDGITSMAIMNLGQAMSFFAGQNVGAGEFNRVKTGYKSALVIALVFCLITALLVSQFGGLLMLLFVQESEVEVITLGSSFIRIMCYFYFIFAPMSISSGLLRGAGDVVFSMVTTVASLAIRYVAASFLIGTFSTGAIGLIYAMPIGWGVAGIANNIRFARGKWKTKAVVSNKAVEA